MGKQPDITFEIPYVTPSWNDIYAIGNYWARKRIVDQERRTTGTYLIGRVRKPLEHKVSISIQHFQKRPYDSDNVCSKIWIDAMKDVGILKNDDHRYVGWVSTRTEKGTEDKTIISIISDH